MNPAIFEIPGLTEDETRCAFGEELTLQRVEVLKKVANCLGITFDQMTVTERKRLQELFVRVPVFKRGDLDRLCAPVELAVMLVETLIRGETQAACEVSPQARALLQEQLTALISVALDLKRIVRISGVK